MENAILWKMQSYITHILAFDYYFKMKKNENT
jgi:hypothetical protein